MTYYTETWAYPSYGTAGAMGWTRGTSSWFSTGVLRWASADGTGLTESATTNMAVACNEAFAAPVGTYGAQEHVVRCYNAAYFTRICTHGTESLWACMVAGLGVGSVELQVFKTVDTTTASPSLLVKAAIATGVMWTEGILSVAYSGGTWILTGQGTALSGTGFIGTLRYAASGFVTGPIRPAIALQCLGGPTYLEASSWTLSGGSEPLLRMWNWHDIATANLPSTITFTGQQGLISRSRSLSGEMLATSGLFVCRCDMYWSNATDTFLAWMRWAAGYYGHAHERIECAWGSFEGVYIPGSLQSNHVTADTNTLSISFMQGYYVSSGGS